MSSQDKSLTKKRGRPIGVKHGEFVGLRVPSDLATALDAWAVSQPEPRPSRSEAIRRLVERGLAAEGAGAVKQLSDTALDTKIAEQKVRIAEIPEYDEPSPEAALATMDKAIAENDLIKMKNKRTARKKAAK